MNKVAPVLCLWAAMWASNLVLPKWYEAAVHPPQELRGKNEIVMELLGESRTLLARYVWFTADNYHELLERQGGAAFHEDDVITLFRIVTNLDPHLDEAYDLMCWDLFKGYEDKTRALDTLNEGLTYNPKSYPLNWLKAFILFHLKRYEEAIPPAELALRYARDDPNQYEIDQLNALRLLLVSYEETGQWQECLRVVDIWRGLRPADTRPSYQLGRIMYNLESKP